MSVQRIHLLTLAACVAIAAAGFALHKSTPKPVERPRVNALSAVPSGAGFAATLDIAQLRKSELGAALLSAGRELPGVGRLDAICGFDPAEQVREVILAMPRRKATDVSELGIAISGDLDAERIAGCAEAVVRRRGGTPARTPIGSFLTIRDRSAPGAEVALRDGGPVLLGEGHFLRDMIDTVQGTNENLWRDALHMALRRQLGEGAALTASWVLDEDWLEQASGERLARLSPLSRVRAAALRVDVAPEISAHALLGCTSADDCRELTELLRNLSSDLGPMLEAELGDNPLDGARVEQQGATVHVRVRLGADRASRIARRLVLRLSAAPAPVPPPSSAPALVPDEIVRP